MGKKWDSTGIAYDLDVWRECLRLLKPGGHLLAFGGTRTYHRMACAIEDAGLEIRDSLHWIYGQGFPKSLDIGKALDKRAGAEREVVGTKLGLPGYSLATSKGAAVYGGGIGGTGDPSKEVAITAPATPEAKQWNGWGTALKPAHEPIVLARKPLVGTVAENVLAYGVGGLNIDGCRIGGACTVRPNGPIGYHSGGAGGVGGSLAGRFPANILADEETPLPEFFRYSPKASKKDRGSGNTHPTVKPVELMRWLVRLVTPPAGLVLDPFTGSGTTLLAAKLEGLRADGIELSDEYADIAAARLDSV
jgi:site-specific DNA-methyltransferase (adenine-specific)